jgi:hypothetical protein
MVATNTVVFQPEGLQQISPGHRPGNNPAINLQALKGRDMDSFVAPLQGLYIHTMATPRAVPWADLLRPLRGSQP